MRDDNAREDLALQAGQSLKAEESGVAQAKNGVPSGELALALQAENLRVSDNTVVPHTFKVAQTGTVVVPPAGSAPVTIVVPNAAGVVVLPAGAGVAAIQVSGSDLRIVLSDGSVLVVEGAASSPPSIQVGSEVVPGASLAAVFGPFQELQPAAGDVLPPAGSLGFTTIPTTIDQAFQFSQLLANDPVVISERGTDLVRSGGGSSGSGNTGTAEEGPFNEPPTAESVADSGDEDTLIEISFEGADSDGTVAGFVVKSLPVSGTLWQNPDGTGAVALGQVVAGQVYFQPDANWNGSSSFEYAAMDNGGAESANATATINIAPVNDTPVANALSVNGIEDTVFAINLSGSDIEGPVQFIVKAAPANGALFSDADATIPLVLNVPFTGPVYFKPDADWDGNTSFQYFAVDNEGLESPAATANIQIDNVNEAPTANDVSASGNEDSLIEVSFDGADSDGTVAGYIVKSLPVNGTLWLNADGTGAVVLGQQVSGTIYFAPDENWNGSAAFDYAVIDNEGAESASATVTLDVNPINDAPTAENVSASGDEDTILTVTFDGADIDGGVAGFIIKTLPANGTLWLNADGTGAVVLGQQVSGTIYFAPDENWNGSSAFDYAAIDNEGAESATATVTLDVAPINDIPLANALNVSGDEDTVVTISLSGSDVEGPVQFVVKVAPANGALFSDSDATIPLALNTPFTGPVYFKPEADWNGDTSFQYYAVDADNAESAPATVSIAIGDANDAPTANDVSASGNEDSLIEVSFDGADSDGTVAGYIVKSLPANGTLWLNADGTGAIALNQQVSNPIYFQPNADWNGGSSFDYVAIDNNGAESANATVSLNVAPVNDAPTAENVSASGDEDTILTVTFDGADIDGTVAGYIVKSLPANGTLWLNANGTGAIAQDQQVSGTIYFRPALNWNGDSSFDYAAIDNEGAESAQATISLHVAPVNDQPFITSSQPPKSINEVDDNAAGENVTVHTHSGTVTFTDVDPGDTHTATFEIRPTSVVGAALTPAQIQALNAGFSIGALDQGSNSVGWTYSISDADIDFLSFSNTVTLTYRVYIQDSAGALTWQVVDIKIYGANDVPVITSGDTFSVQENTTTVGTVTSFDPDIGATRVFSITGGADAGKFNIDAATGALTFKTAPDFENPTDANGDNVYQVRVQVWDQIGGSPGSTQNISVTVTNVNETPAAQNGSFDVSEDGTLTGSVLATDPDTDPLTYSLVNPVDGLVFNPDGTFTFTPGAAFQYLNEGESAQVTFQYQATDGALNSNTATVTITVEGANENGAPTAENVTASGNEDVLITVTLDGDDADGDLEGFIVKSLPANGTLWLNANGTGVVAIGLQVTGTLYFQPNADWNGNTSFTYTAIDSNDVESALATVSIEVDPVNDVPTAENVSAGGNEDTIFAVTFDGADIDGTVAGYIVKSLPANGTLWLNSDGTGAVAINQQVSSPIYFQPNANWNGNSAFDYAAIDNEGAESANATVTLNVDPVNDAPAAENVSATGNEDALITVTLDGDDADGDLEGFIIKSLPNSGTLYRDSGETQALSIGDQVDAGENIYFRPAANFSGEVEFNYTAIDAEGAESVPATVTVDVSPIADAPSFQLVGNTGDKLYFSAFTSSSSGVELWSFDGTTSQMVADIYPGANNSLAGTFGSFVEFNGKLYFNATGTSGSELWSYDGTTAELVADINPSSSSFAGEYGITVFNGSLYFCAFTSGTGFELWKYDGTTAEIVGDIYSGTGNSYAGRFGFTEFDGKLYFSATNGTSGYELWSYDGTTLTMAAEIVSGFIGSDAGQYGFVEYNGKLYFSAYNAASGYELWSFDGTTAQLAADINPGTGASRAGQLGEFIVFNGKLYFTANDGASGYELWSYDGTTAALAADIDAGSAASNAGRYSGFTEFNGKIYFSATTSANGYELWSFDGNDAQLVANIAPGTASSFAGYTSGFTVFNGKLYFNAETSANGNELWSYDGINPPQLASDIVNGAGSSFPGLGSTESKNTFFVFGAGDLVATGDEGEAVTLPAINASLTDIDGSETLTIALSGYPAGATFSVGAFDAGSGKWLITNAAQIAALGTTLLVMTPPANWNGTFTLTVEAIVTDTATLSSGVATDTHTETATVEVTINPGNEAPTAENVSASGNEDTLITITLDGDDADGNLEGFIIQSLPANGTLYRDSGETQALAIGDQVDAGENIYFRPAANFSGEVEFNYTAIDAQGAESVQATASIDVTPVADVPAMNVGALDDIVLAQSFVRIDNGATDESTSSTMTALANGGFVATWQIDRAGAGPDGYDVFARVYDAGGVALSGDIAVNMPNLIGDSQFQTVALSHGGFAVVWVTWLNGGDSSQTEVLARVFDASGDELSSGVIAVNAPNAVDDSAPQVTALADGFVVTWQTLRNDGSNDYDVYARVFDGSGNATGAEFPVNAPNGVYDIIPSIIALSGGGFAVSWINDMFSGDRFVRVYDADGSELSGQISVRGSTTGNVSNNNIVALEGGGFVVTWNANYNTDASTDQNVFARVFDASGAEIPGGLITVSADNAQSDTFARVVALSGGGFAVTWQSRRNADGSSDDDVIARVYDANGVEVSGGEILISAPNTQHDTEPQIAALAGGGFVVAWSATRVHGGSTDSDIIMRVYDASGTEVSSGEIIVNAANNLPDTDPQIFALPDGGFVVTWHQTSLGRHVFMSQQFDESGNATGAPLNWGNSQFNPQTQGSYILGQSVAVDSSGAMGVTVDVRDDYNGFRFGTLIGFGASGVAGGAEDAPLSLPEIAVALADTDGSETLVIALSGFPAGATFSVGALDAGSGKWLITDPQDIAGLASVRLTMNPPANYSGSFDLTVEAIVTDSASINSATQTDTHVETRTIPVLVQPVNDLPVANAVSVSGNEDTIIAVTLSGSDVEGPVNFIIKSLPANGTLWLNSDGTGSIALNQQVTGPVYFNPNADWNGNTSFSYSAIDGSGAQSGNVTASIQVDAVPDAPTVSAISRSTNEDTIRSIFLNANDPEDGTFTFVIKTLPANGTLHLLSNGSDAPLSVGAIPSSLVYFKPAPNWNGQTSFDYTAIDPTNLESAPGTVTMTVNPVNDIPVANAVSVSGNEDTTLTVNLSGSDIEGAVNFVIKTLPLNGTLWLNSNGTGAIAVNQQVTGTLYFQPNANFSGEVEFNYTAIDDEGAESAQATATIDVAPIADAPALQIIGVGAGKLFFNATDAENGSELWSFDGTTAQRVTDIRNGADSSNAGQTAIYEYNGKLYFTARDSADNQELWSYDGSTAQLEAEILTGAQGSYAGQFGFIEYDGKLFFGANGGTGTELWSFDGTTAQLEAEIYSGNVGSNPDQGGFAVYNGKLYFGAQNDTIGGHELWSFDGTTAALVAEIRSGISGSLPKNFKEFDGKLYFSASDGTTSGIELWSFDGTAVQLAANINPGPASSFAGNESGFTEYNGKLYFSADGGSNGFEIWSFDGTDAELEADIRSGPNSSFAGDTGGFTEFNGKLYFCATYGPANFELWSFDGTTAVQVGEIYTGQFGSYAGRAGFAVYDGKLYFSAAADGLNYELWSYDGINAPQLAAEIYPGPLSSNAGQGPMVVFGAGGPITGAEDTDITMPAITASLTDTDGSETLTFALSGYPAGATFSVGALDAGSGKWLITNAAEIADLDTTPLVMTPPANWNGTFTLTVEAIVTDTATLSSGVVTDTHTETATFDVTIDAVDENTAPTAQNVMANGDEDAIITVVLFGSDNEGPVNYVIKSLPANGTLWLNANGTGAVAIDQQVTGTLYFQSNANWNGSTSFNYTAIDGEGTQSATATAYLTVNSVNDAPVANSVSATGNEDTTLTVNLSGSDVEGVVNFIVKSLPTNGTLWLNANGTGAVAVDQQVTTTLYFQPNANWNGNSSFTYTAIDSEGTQSAAATASLTVNSVNDAPVFTSSANFSIAENTTTVGTVASSDVDGGARTYLIVGGADAARFTINASSGALAFVTAPNFESPADAGGNNVYEVEVQANDGLGGLTQQLINVSVTNVNEAPVANLQVRGTLKNTILPINFTATDPEGGSLQYVIKSLPSSGTLHLVSNGSDAPLTAGAVVNNPVYFKPALNFLGDVSFNFAAVDPLGLESSPTNFTVSVQPSGENEAPVANAVLATGNEDTTLTVNLSGSDSDGTVAGYTVKSLPANGTLWLNSNGTGAVAVNQQVGSTLYFKPNANFSGEVEFTYTAIDAEGAESAQATATIDVAPVADAANLQIVEPSKGELVFGATVSGHGNSLVTFDGTNAQVVPGGSGISPSQFAGRSFEEFNGKLYFFATTGAAGQELWSYDGTTATLAADILPGNGSSYAGGEYGLPSGFTEFDGKLYFVANDGVNGAELWSYDGTNAALAADINNGPGSSNAGVGFSAVYNGKLYFSADDGTNGTELWSYDGTNAELVADIYQGPGGYGHKGFTVFDDKLYFWAEVEDEGYELWSYDGTTAQLAADIGPPSLGASYGGWTSFAEYNGKLFFGAYYPGGQGLWSFDGTNAALESDVSVSVSNPPIVFQGKLYFAGSGDTGGYELWSFDGTNAEMVYDINPSGASQAGFGGFAIHDGKLYFSANDGTNGHELWSYDGVNPPILAANLPSSSSGSSAGRYLLTTLGADAPIGGDEDSEITLPKINASFTDTDGSETLTIALSGYPAGATFSVGSFDVGSGKWLITNAAEIADLDTMQLTMTPPTNWNGTFTMTVEAITTDTATLSSGTVTDTHTETATFDVTIDPVANTLVGGPGADTFLFTSLDVTDVIQDYSGIGGDGDLIDLSSLFQNDDPVANGIVSHVGNELRIDLDGAGPDSYAVAATFSANPAANTISILYTDTSNQQQTMVI